MKRDGDPRHPHNPVSFGDADNGKGVRQIISEDISCEGWVSVSTSPEKIKKTKAYRSIRKSLLDQLERGGNDLPHFTDLVEDYMKMYIIKEMANDDIMERGTYVEWRNSDTQYGSKKNDSVDQILKTNQQMIKLLDKLGIQPDAGMDLDDEEM